MAEFDAPIGARWDGPHMGISFPDPSIIKDRRTARLGELEVLEKDAHPDLPSRIDDNDRGLWAPDVFRDDKGHYAMYFAGKQGGGRRCIGVATARARSRTLVGPLSATRRAEAPSTPTRLATATSAGSYGRLTATHWAAALPCTGGKKGSDCKPTPIKIQKVARGGITLQGSPKTILNHNGASDDGLVEGLAIYKIHLGQYVLFFSRHCYSSDRYDIQYAFSRTPDSPYTRAGVLAKSGGNPPIYGPGHMDIDKGEYVAFHGRTAPGNPKGSKRYMFTGRIGFVQPPQSSDPQQYIPGRVVDLTAIPFDTKHIVANTDNPLTMSTVTGTALQSSHPPTIPLPFNANQPETIRLYPLSNYTFGVKETQPEEDPSVIARLKRLEEHYGAHGMRRTCEGILVCHEHNHPHILMLQIANAFFKLPGDYLRPEDEEIEGFKARLDERLAPVGRLGEGEEAGDWQIGDCLAQWWRPNFEPFMYPFIPGHVTRPKECKKLYFIQLPKSKVLSVPKNMKLLAVPLFELYDNTARYGPQLSAIPHLLSRYNFEFVNENGEVVAATPGSGPEGYKPKTKVLAGGDEDMNDVKDENGTS
ncbi:hypothetical protein DL767_003202 [Monosporascus sp. MG133]|nr:hypothetical protein DL767_003202 [Monosporascus sp. MG133]